MQTGPRSLILRWGRKKIRGHDASRYAIPWWIPGAMQSTRKQGRVTDVGEVTQCHDHILMMWMRCDRPADVPLPGDKAKQTHIEHDDRTGTGTWVGWTMDYWYIGG